MTSLLHFDIPNLTAECCTAGSKPIGFKLTDSIHGAGHVLWDAYVG
jgi:hypothetical protein